MNVHKYTFLIFCLLACFEEADGRCASGKTGLKAGDAAVAVRAVNSSAECITTLTDRHTNRQTERQTHAHTLLVCLTSTVIGFD